MPRRFKQRFMSKVRSLFLCHSKTPRKTLQSNNSTSLSEPPKIVMERRLSGSPSNEPVKQKPKGIRFSKRAVQRSKFLREKFGVRKTVMGFSPRVGSIIEEDENDIELWRLAENAEDVISDGLAWLNNDDGDDGSGKCDDARDDDDDDDNNDDDDETILQRWIESNSFDSLDDYDDDDNNVLDDDDVLLLSDDDDDDDDIAHDVDDNCNGVCYLENDDDDNDNDKDCIDGDNVEKDYIDCNDDYDNVEKNYGGDDDDNDHVVDNDDVFASHYDLQSDPNDDLKVNNEEQDKQSDDDTDDKNGQHIQESITETFYRKHKTRDALEDCYHSYHIKGNKNMAPAYSTPIHECVDINSNNCLQQSDYGDRNLINSHEEKDLNHNYSLNGINKSEMSTIGASSNAEIIKENNIRMKNNSDNFIEEHVIKISRTNNDGNRRSSNRNDDDDNDGDGSNYDCNVFKDDVSQTPEGDVTCTLFYGNTMSSNHVISHTAKTRESQLETPTVANANSHSKTFTGKANSVKQFENDITYGSSEASVICEKENRGSVESEDFEVGNENEDIGFENLFNSMTKEMEVVWSRIENIENDFILARNTITNMKTTKKN